MASEIQLPANTLQDMEESEKRIVKLEDFLVKAQSAGMDVNRHQERLREQKTKLSRMKTAFFPTV